MTKKIILATLLALVLFVAPCFAANILNRNPRYIDTFGADVTISTKPIFISCVIMEGASLGDTVVFIDSDGNVVLRLSNTANGGSIIWCPSRPFYFPNGFIMDDSASSLAANDIVMVFGN